MNIIFVVQFIFISLAFMLSIVGFMSAHSKSNEESAFSAIAMVLFVTWATQLSAMIYYFAAIYPMFAAKNT